MMDQPVPPKPRKTLSDLPSPRDQWRHALSCHLEECLDRRICGGHDCTCQLPQPALKQRVSWDEDEWDPIEFRL